MSRLLNPPRTFGTWKDCKVFFLSSFTNTTYSLLLRAYKANIKGDQLASLYSNRIKYTKQGEKLLEKCENGKLVIII